MSKSNLSRRALVSTAVALSAAAIANGIDPTFAQIASDHPDAELLGLGEKLAQIEQERTVQLAIDCQEMAPLEAEVERRTGFALATAHEMDPQALEASGYWAIRSEVCKTFERSKDPELEVWDGISHRLNSAVDKILARKASTVEGLSVQARATVLAAAELWDPVSDDKSSHERLFIEATCSFLGLDARRIADGALPAGPVVAASIDPIFGKIEKFKTACDRLDAVCGHEPLFGSPECAAWEAEEAQALDLFVRSGNGPDLDATGHPIRRGGRVEDFSRFQQRLRH